ncbi:hypothetical protein TWF481_008832 [Arthrobotrys musiformis]|uniref:Uncharacterized protein n=1 Tax=Arthrobotrys musiformis TaxID=47236 RepID=A0AAV9W9U4_9PEZI
MGVVHIITSPLQTDSVGDISSWASTGSYTDDAVTALSVSVSSLLEATDISSMRLEVSYQQSDIRSTSFPDSYEPSVYQAEDVICVQSIASTCNTLTAMTEIEPENQTAELLIDVSATPWHPMERYIDGNWDSDPWSTSNLRVRQGGEDETGSYVDTGWDRWVAICLSDIDKEALEDHVENSTIYYL